MFLLLAKTPALSCRGPEELYWVTFLRCEYREMGGTTLNVLGQSPCTLSLHRLA